MLSHRFNKLRGMHGDEIKGRARQAALKLGERISPFSGREMSDRKLLRHFALSRSPRPEDAAKAVLTRLYNETHPDRGIVAVSGLFPSLGYRDEVVKAMQERFPEERSAIFRKADDACLGRFHLMGFGEISFGSPIDWQLEPISGRRTPLRHWSRIDYLDAEVAGDKKITWELNRHQHFVTLGQAYWMTGDERYAAAFSRQITSWMDANPPGMGINWASSLELSLRLVAWMWALYLFSGSEHLTPRLMARLLKFVVAQARHIDAFTSHYFSPNTHLTGEALGLLYCGAALPELRQASYWRSRGIQILLSQLPIQVLPDGVYFERSTYYHRYTVDFYMHLVLLAGSDSTSLDTSVRERLTRMLDHLMWIHRPDGRSALIGDDDGGRLIALGVRDADDFRDTLSTGAALFGREDWKYVAGAAAVETLWLLGPPGLDAFQAIRAVAPRDVGQSFQDAGFYVMRDGWDVDSACVILSSGRQEVQPAAHAHSDSLSFEFAVASKQWLVDPGTFTYTGSAAPREELRSERRHNTAIVDGKCHSRSSGPFSWKKLVGGHVLQFTSSSTLSYCRVAHDGYAGLADPVRCARQFALLRTSQTIEGGRRPAPYLIVSDDFAAAGPHSYEVNLTFDPSCSVTVEGSRVVARYSDSARLEIFSGGTAATSTSPCGAFVSRCYGQGQAAPAAIARSAGRGAQQIVCVMLPSRGETERAVEFKDVAGQELVEFRVISPECEDHVLVANSWAHPRNRVLNGALAVTRRSLGVLESAVLIAGDRLAMDDISIISSAVVEHCQVDLRAGRAEITVRGEGHFELEVRVGGRCLRVEAPVSPVSRIVSRSFDLSAASVVGTGR